MQVTIKYFASLREILGKSEETMTIQDNISIGELWTELSEDKPVVGTVLMAQNMTYVGAETLLSDGDEIAFFPPVTGG